MKIKFETLEEKLKRQEGEAYLSHLINKLDNNQELEDSEVRYLIKNHRAVEDEKGQVLRERRTSYIKLRNKYYRVKWEWGLEGWYLPNYSKLTEVFIKEDPYD